MSEPTVRRVHVFRGSILIANLTTVDRTPEESYLVDGVSYTVTTCTGPFLERDGGEGWDVQVDPPDTDRCALSDE